VRRLFGGLLVLAALVLAQPTSAVGARVITVLGDSLTAGLGVAADEAFPALLQARLQREGYDYRVVNAGVSGDTSAGGLRRVDWVLKSKPDLVVVALGANDGLRGQPPAALRDNLEAIIARLRAAGAQVLLAGMRMPPNYGAEYTKEFAAVFPEVARRTRVAFMPFLLDGVAAEPRFLLPDGLHPSAAGHRVIAGKLWPHLVPLLRRPA
jgi:acyl-CoA thioesterase I